MLHWPKPSFLAVPPSLPFSCLFNWQYLFSNFFSFAVILENPKEKKNALVDLGLKYFWRADWNTLVQFSSTLTCQCVASWHLWFIVLLIFKLNLQLYNTMVQLVPSHFTTKFTLSLPICFCAGISFCQISGYFNLSSQIRITICVERAEFSHKAGISMLHLALQFTLLLLAKKSSAALQ